MVIPPPCSAPLVEPMNGHMRAITGTGDLGVSGARAWTAGETPAGGVGGPGISDAATRGNPECFGDPEAKLIANMEECLANTFMMAVWLKDQLK